MRSGQAPLPPGIRLIDACSFDDYAAWYLAREARKGRRFRRPADAAGRAALMEHVHAGKLLPGISAWQWWHCRLQSVDTLAALFIPRSSQSVSQGLIDPVLPRTLGVAVDRLLADRFFERLDPPGAPMHPFRRYYRRLLAGGLQLRGGDRFALRSLTPMERREAGDRTGLYLLDGVGRAVPYLALLRQGRLRFRPIEALLALSGSILFSWPAASLRHGTGEPVARGTRWLCTPGRHRPGHALYGPYASLPAERLVAIFHLHTEPGERAANIDVYDARHRRALASAVVDGGSRIALPFCNVADGVIEFRVFWYGACQLELERVDLALDRS